MPGAEWIAPEHSCGGRVKSGSRGSARRAPARSAPPRPETPGTACRFRSNRPRRAREGQAAGPRIAREPGKEMDHMHGTRLPQTVDTADSLLETRGVPRRLEIDDRRGRLQIEANAAGVGGEEDLALGVEPEFL